MQLRHMSQSLGSNTIVVQGEGYAIRICVTAETSMHILSDSQAALKPSGTGIPAKL